ncbi:MAG: hypothetical protein LBN18_02030 [Dysgonamonadaceae bacterium]|nr:hypothetical protein [Dysgonamonadaceae bacterium]
MKKKIILTIVFVLLSTSFYAQSSFIQRLSVYYDTNITNKDSLCSEIWRDTIIKNQGNYKEFIHFTDSYNTLYRDTLISINILYLLQGNNYQREIDLTNVDKIKILTYISDIILSDYNKSVKRNINDKDLTTYLICSNFWILDRLPNDSITHSSHLINNLHHIIKERSECLPFSTVRLFNLYGLNSLFSLIVEHAIKPNFKEGKSVTNNTTWGHIYFLTKYNNKEVLPYLYKALSESGCSIDYYMEKYTNTGELAFLAKDMNIRKNIYLNLLKDDCITELIVPTLYRYDTSEVSYFERIILERIKYQYDNFPIETVRKMNTKKQIEYVKKWIQKNM